MQAQFHTIMLHNPIKKERMLANVYTSCAKHIFGVLFYVNVNKLSLAEICSYYEINSATSISN